jgi:hypothetical protein
MDIWDLLEIIKNSIWVKPNSSNIIKWQSAPASPIYHTGGILYQLS